MGRVRPLEICLRTGDTCGVVHAGGPANRALRAFSPTNPCEAAVNGLSSSAQAFAEQVFCGGSWRAELPPTTSFSLKGARAMSELVLEHPALKADGRPDMQLRLFGPTDDDGLETLRRHSVGYLLSGAVALGLMDRDIGEDLAAGLIHAAADPGPESPSAPGQPQARAAVRAPATGHPGVAAGDRSLRREQLLRWCHEGGARGRAMGKEPVELLLYRHHEDHALARVRRQPADAARQRIRGDPPRWRGGVRAHDRTAPPRDDLEVKVEWPASLSATEIVRWRASADGCFASLGYSNDGGETWTPLALPGPGDTIQVDAGALPGGRECALELIVTDGFQTRRIRSDAYEVEPKGWVLQILSPAAGAKLPPGQPVLLAAQGYHLEERRAGRRHRVGMFGRRRPGHGRPCARHPRAGRAHDHRGRVAQVVVSVG